MAAMKARARSSRRRRLRGSGAGSRRRVAPGAAHTSAGTKLAQASLLRVGDFGSGWTADPATGTVPGLSFSCPGFTPKQNDIVEIGTADARRTFRAQAASGPFVVQRTSVYASSKAAQDALARAVKPELIDCVAQSLEALDEPRRQRRDHSQRARSSSATSATAPRATASSRR